MSDEPEAADGDGLDQPPASGSPGAGGFYEMVVWYSLAAIVICWGFILGLHTVRLDDAWFLLNDARWLVTQHEIPWVDHYSWTAQGKRWIYPLGAGLLFYGAWHVGGYAALSYLGATMSGLTTALLLRRGSWLSLGLTALAAVPISYRMTQPRADHFSVVLAAALTRLLWRWRETGRGRLWLVPALMALWANLHLGFILGLLLIAGYVGAELLEPSEGAFVRLRRAWPWLVASVPATLVNPYGYWVYVAVHDQLAAPWARTIEWQPLPVLSLARAPFPVLLMYAPVVIVLAVVGGIAIAALRQRRWGAAAWLGAAALATFQNRRFVELPGIVAALVAPAVLKERFRVPVFAAAVLAGGAVFWGAVPGYPPPLEMAAGLGTAVPVEAMDFLEREDLPGRIYDYNSGYGSYLVWRLFPKYQDSFDSRLIPFGASGFGHAEPRPAIATSAALYEWAARNQVNMILLSMVVPPVPQLCGAADWSLVYRDTKAAIMLRRWAATEKFIRRLQIC